MRRSWAREEFETVELGDKRLKSRLVDIAEAFSSHPEASIPQATIEWKRTKGSYRFFDNKKVKAKKILEAHQNSNLKRANKYTTTKRLFAIQDTTEIKYATHPSLELGHGGSLWGNSLFLHGTLIVTEEHIPLGLIDQQVWIRKEVGVRHKKRERPIEQKESYKWLKSIQATSLFQEQKTDTHVVSICDREGDVYDLFAEVKAQQEKTAIDLLVRSAWNRRLEEPEGEGAHLIETLSKQAPVGQYTLTIPRNGRRKERSLKLEVRYSKVTIKPPLNRSKEKHLMPIELWAVEAKEIQERSKKECVKWRLLTTYEVSDFESAKLMLDWYTKRWIIEEYFRVLKSGCAIEERQLRTSDRLENCLAIDSIIAWRILFLMYIGRKKPDLPASILFNKIEQTVLYGFIHKTPKPPPREPSIEDMMKWLAKLGGFLGRKNDGFPGAEVLWRGSWKLPDIIAAWSIFSS